MNGIKYLLDTNIIIGMYERSTAVIDLFESKKVAIYECAYSSVTRMELLGFPNIAPHEINTLSVLLEQMNGIAISRAVEDMAIQVKQQYHLKLPDAIILATAIINQIELLTLDKKLANKI